MDLGQIKLITDNYKIGVKIEGKNIEGFGQVFGVMDDKGDKWVISVYDETGKTIFRTKISKNLGESEVIKNIKTNYGVSF